MTAGNRPQSTQDDPAQSQRFIDMAHEVGASDDEAMFEAKVKAIARHKPAKEGQMLEASAVYRGYKMTPFSKKESDTVVVLIEPDSPNGLSITGSGKGHGLEEAMASARGVIDHALPTTNR